MQHCEVIGKTFPRLEGHKYCPYVDTISLNLHGQPQCLEKEMRTGFPSSLGKFSGGSDGALVPMSGTSSAFTCPGKIHEDSS